MNNSSPDVNSTIGLHAVYGWIKRISRRGASNHLNEQILIYQYVPSGDIVGNLQEYVNAASHGRLNVFVVTWLVTQSVIFSENKGDRMEELSHGSCWDRQSVHSIMSM